MAYRFNPPPNWPIEDPQWSPPPGWQPDPAWGPAPDGWNFWIDADAAVEPEPAAEPEPTAAEPEPTAAEPEPTAVAPEEQPPADRVDDDATRVADSGQPESPAPDEDPTHVSGADAVHVGSEPSSPEPAGSGPQELGTDAPEPAPASTDAEAPVVAEAPVAAADGSTAGEELTPGENAAPGERFEVEEPEPTQPASTSAETAEYAGPELDADLAQRTPYESSAADPAAEAPGTQEPFQSQPIGPGQQPAAEDQPTPADQQGHPSPEQGYGQAAPPTAPGYGQAPSHDQAASAQQYGQASPAQQYGQASPAQPYGQAPSYGPGSPAAQPPSYTGSPSADSATWTASTAPGDAPKKGVIARFWWVGCIVLVLIVLLIAVIGGGVLLLNRDSGEERAEGATTQEQSAEESGSAEETVDEESMEVVTPTNLATVDAAAEPVDIVSTDGSGTMTVSMAWVADEDLPSTYGGTVTPSDNGDEFLVVTARLIVEDGTIDLNSYQFEVVTPYGGTLSPATSTYELEGSGLDYDAPSSFAAGDEYTIQILFDPSKAGGMVLEFDSYSDVYSWDIAAS